MLNRTVRALLFGSLIFFFSQGLSFVNSLLYFIFFAYNSHRAPALVYFSVIANIVVLVLPYVFSALFEYKARRSWGVVCLGLLINILIFVTPTYSQYQRHLAYQKDSKYKQNMSYPMFIFQNAMPSLDIAGVISTPQEVNYKAADTLDIADHAGKGWNEIDGTKFFPVTLHYTHWEDGTDPGLTPTISLYGRMLHKIMPEDEVRTFISTYQNSLLAKNWHNSADSPYFRNVGFLLNYFSYAKKDGPCNVMLSESALVGVQGNNLRLVILDWCSVASTVVNGPVPVYLFISDITDISPLYAK